MPSDSIAGFLGQAQANRVLVPEQVEQLIRQPDIPQSDLNELCNYLESRGVLSRFQSGMLRSGQGHALVFAKYPLLDEVGPCPGGTEFKATHPSLKTPVIVRRFRNESLAPIDSAGALIARARAAASIHHANIVPLLDVGFHEDEGYVAIEPSRDSADLQSLVKEIGPMPVFLAAEYGRQIASALRVAHERGSNHGDVRPENLIIGPMTNKAGADGRVKRRPAPNATVKLSELGLVPLRNASGITDPGVLAYLPPERLDQAFLDPRGDLYGLGASLYCLLTGRAPFTGNTTTEILEKIKTTEPTSLTALRPDLPTDWVAVVVKMLSKKPGERYATAFDVEAALAKFCRPGTVAAPKSAVPLAEAAPVADEIVEEAASAESEDGWDSSMAFSTSHASSEPPPRKPMTDEEKGKTRLMLVLGLCLHLTAVGLLVAWLTGAFKSSPEPKPAPKSIEQDTPKKNKGPIRNPRDVNREND